MLRSCITIHEKILELNKKRRGIVEQQQFLNFFFSQGVEKPTDQKLKSLETELFQKSFLGSLNFTFTFLRNSVGIHRKHRATSDRKRRACARPRKYRMRNYKGHRSWQVLLTFL